MFFTAVIVAVALLVVVGTAIRVANVVRHALLRIARVLDGLEQKLKDIDTRLTEIREEISSIQVERIDVRSTPRMTLPLARHRG